MNTTEQERVTYYLQTQYDNSPALTERRKGRKTLIGGGHILNAILSSMQNYFNFLKTKQL